MEKIWRFVVILMAFAVIQLCNALPVDLLSHNDGPNAQLIGVLVAVMVSVCIIVAFIGCTCCERRRGFKEPEVEKKVFRDSPVGASVINETSLTGDDPGHVNPIASSEFTIFTPLSPPHHNNNVFRSQPSSIINYNNDLQNESQHALPKVVSPQVDGIDVSKWFDGSEPDFPRSKLKYIQELGTGWFGRVVEGEAQGIIDNQQSNWSPVAVRILESSASAHEQALFLHEVTIYRTEPHDHILRLLGRCLEATPLLLIQEFCPKGDLKSFLLKNQTVNGKNSPVGIFSLNFCCQLASGIQFLHEKNIPILDLAARTCQLTSELTLKIGDYGCAVSQYPNDYYQGTPSIPVRWSAPETLNFTSTTLQPKQITLEANIWSLGVTMWEICELGKQPYEWLTDDEVISQVLGSPHIRLPQPSMNTTYFSQPLYRLMQLCWQPQDSRPQINQIYSMLLHLYQNSPPQNSSSSPSKISTSLMEDFESRWETFKPNTIVKLDNQIVTTKEESNEKNQEDELFVQPEKLKSPSLQNLHGSFENLIEENPEQNMDSWLQNVVNNTSDLQYVRGLSQAIQALDSALASEQTSSSASSFEPNQDQNKFEDSINRMDSILDARRSESGSETEDETWKRRIERGAYSEKVRQKSKSVADLMILTHIECSDTDSETPLQSLEYRVNYKNVRCKPNSSFESSSLMFGSEGNLLEVQHAFQEELRKLQEERRDSLLFVPATESIKICDNSNNIKSNIDLDENCDIKNDPSLRDEIKTIISEITTEAVNKVQQEILPDLIIESKISQQELPTPDNHKNQEYSWIQNFINMERRSTLPDEKIDKQIEFDEQLTVPANLLDLKDNSHKINQVFNVYNVQIDHKPPPEVFESPIKNLYNKPFTEPLVCTSSLPNDQLLPLINGLHSDLSKKEELNLTPKKLSDLASDILLQNSSYLDDFDIVLQSNKTIRKQLQFQDLTLPDICNDLKNESNRNETKNTLKSPRRLTDIILDSLKNNPDYVELKQELESPKNNLNVQKKIPEAKEENIVSFVSEGDELIDSQSSVILGPCEDYTLGLYSGLKTTFEKYSDDDRPEEEILQFSSNFMPFSNNLNYEETTSGVDYSLETWGNFLEKSLQEQENGPTSLFDENFSPREEESLVNVFEEKNEIINNNNNNNKTINLTNNTITFDNNTMDLTYNCDNNLDNNTENQEQKFNATFILDQSSSLENNKKDMDNESTVLNSWEPGEGWFLHPQTPPENLTGDIDISGSDNTDDNSYVRFTLDEECVNALRNELAAKLPHAQGNSHEEQQEPEEWDTSERNEIIVKYNVYATPLSPIPEESCCDDAYCDQIQHRDGSDTDSDWSEPEIGRNSQLEEDILVIDTETHTAQLLESPSLREPQNRHTPSQDSCCSNDTLFNLEELNCGVTDNEENSPQHYKDDDNVITIEKEISDEPNFEVKLSTDDESPMKFNEDDDFEFTAKLEDSSELNLTYTKPDINVDDSENEINNTTITLNSSPAIMEDNIQSTIQSKNEEVLNPNNLTLNLDTNFGVAPLPSPEDIPWKQIPASLLTYNEMIQKTPTESFEIHECLESSENLPSEETTEAMIQEQFYEDQTNENGLEIDGENVLEEDISCDSQKDNENDLYSNLTDIRFSGPCDGQLMSTSFSESADFNDERDWDSGSDTRSSSSGEFIWKEGEHEESLRALHAASNDVGVTDDVNPMDAIEEENSNSSEDSDDCEEDLEELEFVPSTWDAQATPTKSALRSPEQSANRKSERKGVWFKKQKKYHCVYEYPREPESPVAPNSDIWRPLSDFSNFTDLELDPESCVPNYDESSDCRDGYDSVLDKFITRNSYPLASGSSRHRDLYQLNHFPEFAASGTDDDFYISSSARPFQTIGQSSQFFPGLNTKNKFMWQDYQSSSSQSSRDLSDNITPDSGIDDITPDNGILDNLSSPIKNNKKREIGSVQSLKYLAEAVIKRNETATVNNGDVKGQESLGGLRHTRNRLKLDLPPSPSSFTSNRSFSIDLITEPILNREIPTFTTFGKTRFSVQHVPTPTDDDDDNNTPDSNNSQGKSKIKNVSFEALPHVPLKNLSNTVYIVDRSTINQQQNKQKPVIESVQGEASLLDSADEDSGIESSANATLERHQEQILN